MPSSTAATMSALRLRTFFSTATTCFILQYAASRIQAREDPRADAADRVPLDAASSATALTVQRTARQATQSSKSRVKREPGLAQGTDSTRTPCSGHATRLTRCSR